MTGFALKLVALITMAIDHTGAVLEYSGDFDIMRSIGRMSFPIYAYLASEGLRRTQDIRNYMKRLLLFAFISQIPFSLLFENIKYARIEQVTFIDISHLNVFFTIFAGALAVYCYEKLKAPADDERVVINNSIALLCSTAILYSAETLDTDYGFIGAAFVFLLYIIKERKYQIIIMMVFIIDLYASSPLPPGQIQSGISSATLSISGISQTLRMFGITERLLFACAAPLLVCFYNGKRGPAFKWMFYAAYPAHLIVLAAIWFIYVNPSLFS